MKTKLYLTLIVATIALAGLTSCGSSQTAAQKQEMSEKIRQKVDNLEFVFKANYAYPSFTVSTLFSPQFLFVI